MSYKIEERSREYLLFTICRNEKRNAIDYEIMQGLKKAIELSKAPHIKALVITGEGDRAFCAGGDLSVFHLLKTKEEAYKMLNKMSQILYELLILPKPTIALMNGFAVGGGCELAISCDFRVASKDTRAGFIQGNQAITTGWGGGSMLVEKIPNSSSMKLLMDGEIQTAAYLKEIGFFDHVYEGNSIEACEIFLEKLLLKETNVLQAYKRLQISKWESNRLRARIEEEVKACSILWEQEAHHQYVASFLNNKKS